MNEYEEAIFLYIQENKMRKIYRRRDHQTVNRQEKALYEAFASGLTDEQKRQFRRYEEKITERFGIEEEVLFTETLAAVRGLLFPTKSPTAPLR